MFVPGTEQCKRNQRRKKLGLKTVMVMIAADQGRDKNLSLLNVQCYLYGHKFLTVLRNFTYKEDHRNFPVAKRKSDRE